MILVFQTKISPVNSGDIKLILSPFSIIWDCHRKETSFVPSSAKNVSIESYVLTSGPHSYFIHLLATIFL